MFELLALTALIYLFLTRRKKPRTPRTLDAELKQLIQESTDATAIGAEIKRFFLGAVLNAKLKNRDRNRHSLILQAESQWVGAE